MKDNMNPLEEIINYLESRKAEILLKEQNSELSERLSDRINEVAYDNIPDDECVEKDGRIYVSEVDNESINVELWKKVLEEVHELLLKTNDHILRVVDLGAGLLNMFEKLVGDESIGKENIFFDQIQYTAYESNQNLVAHCVKKLVELGYERDKNSFENIFHGTLPNGIAVTFHLKCIDFSNDVIADESGAHLVIGSCFADLYDPDLLVNSLLRFLNFGKDGQSLANKETLVYFPITFSGTTSFFPPSSFGPSCIPSDTIAFQAYSQSLTNMGHNLDPFAIGRFGICLSHPFCIFSFTFVSKKLKQ